MEVERERRRRRAVRFVVGAEQFGGGGRSGGRGNLSDRQRQVPRKSIYILEHPPCFNAIPHQDSSRSCEVVLW
jgi:hypothetical protein